MGSLARLIERDTDHNVTTWRKKKEKQKTPPHQNKQTKSGLSLGEFWAAQVVRMMLSTPLR